MTPREFDRLVGQTRLQPRAVRMARAVLCEGVSCAEAGRREGVSRQAAWGAEQSVLRALRTGYPDDWAVVTVVVPPDAADEIAAVAAESRTAAAEDRREK